MRKIIVALALILFVIPSFGKSYGPTTSQDHLWRVALKVRPSHTVIPQQVMVAIVKINPSAFLYRNVNGMKTGYYLRIPTLAKVKEVSADRAIQIVSKQNKSWARHNKSNKKPMPRSYSKQKHEIAKLTTQQTQNAQDVATLKQQLLATNKTILNLNQDYQTRFNTLTHNSNMLAGQLDNLNQKIEKIRSKLQQLKMTAQRYQQDYWYWAAGIGGLFILLLLLVWLSTRRKNRNIKEADAVEATEVEAEYDFMASEESIPAKLDLARAYIDMDDKKAARKVLKEILQIGNDEQKQEAEKLLEQVN